MMLRARVGVLPVLLALALWSCTGTVTHRDTPLTDPALSDVARTLHLADLSQAAAIRAMRSAHERGVVPDEAMRLFVLEIAPASVAALDTAVAAYQAWLDGAGTPDVAMQALNTALVALTRLAEYAQEYGW